MTPDEFARIGLKLYRRRWKSAMARELGRHPVTIHKWLRLPHIPPHPANHVKLLARRGEQSKPTKPRRAK